MPAETRTPTRPPRRGRMDAALGCALVALFAAVFAGFAWTRTAAKTTTVSYLQRATLSYTAATRPGSIYGPTGLKAGQPIYLSAVRGLHLRYTYSFSAARPALVAGTAELRASISNGAGITRSLPIDGGGHFAGDRATIGGTLDLSALSQIAGLFDSGPGASLDAAYPVTISMAVSVHGAVGPRPVEATFRPAVKFTYASGILTPSQATPLLPGAPTPSASPFATTATGSVRLPGSQSVPMVFGLSVAEVRTASLVLLALALLGAMAAARPLVNGEDSGGHDGIALRYRGLLVEAGEPPRGRPGSVVVTLSSFADLAKVARRLECPIVHSVADGHRYAVVDNGTLYEHRSPAPGVEPASIDLTTHAAAAPGGPIEVGRVAEPGRRDEADAAAPAGATIFHLA